MKDIVWNNGKKISKDLIYELEKLWDIKFPKAYVDIILENDGGYPDMYDEVGNLKEVSVDCNEIGEIGFYLLKLSSSKGITRSRIVSVWKIFMETLPEPNKIFPFAESGSGDIIYFDYRKDLENPSILYQDHERAISKDDLADYQLEERPLKEWLNDSLVPIADSFEELLGRAYPSNW